MDPDPGGPKTRGYKSRGTGLRIRIRTKNCHGSAPLKKRLKFWFRNYN
jgi:hypothetical protein